MTLNESTPITANRIANTTPIRPAMRVAEA